MRADIAQSFPDDPLLGRALDGRYALYDVLGRGGMGAVYRGRHLKLGHDVAVKTIRTEDRSAHPDFDVRERFFLEARMLAGMRNPGIVRLLDYGEDDGLLYMVLELLEGVTLHGLLRGRTCLALPRAVGFAVGMLRALGEPHGAGLVHRDIKPSNVMVRTGADGVESITLIDFGVAKVVESDDEELSGPATRTGLTIGTPRYMSPEQLAHEEVGAWSDQYAVAIVLFRMLAGQTPFTGPPAVVVAAHLKDSPPPLPAELEAPPAVEAVILRALSKHPAERFDGCAAMADALEAAMLTGERSTAPTLAPTVALAVEGDELDPESIPFTPPWRGEVSEAPEPAPRRLRMGLMLAAALVAAAGVLIALYVEPAHTEAPIVAAQPVRVQIGAATRPVVAQPVVVEPVVERPDAAVPVEAPVQVTSKAAPTSAPAAPKRRVASAAEKPKPKPVRRRVRRPAKATRPASAPASAMIRRAAPPADPVARFNRALSACRCDAAEAALDTVPLDREAGLRRTFRARCKVVGLGCLTSGRP